MSILGMSLDIIIQELSHGAQYARGTPGLGLGWFLGKGSRGVYAEHSGGGPGISPILRIYPRKKIAIAVMGNMKSYDPGKILGFTADLLFYYY